MLSVPWRSAALAAALAAIAACSDSRHPRGCHSGADCPSDAMCVMGACVAGSLPEAKIRLRGDAAELVSHREITFDGTESVNTNPGGSVKAYAWAIRRREATRCDPQPASGDGAALTTIFTCEGAYDVELKVKNDLGLESPPQLASISIARSTNPPTIESIGGALSVGHRCAGAPLVCTPLLASGATDIPLDVRATDTESQDALAYAWSFQPPPGVDASAIRARFDPDPFTRTPTVHVETDGTRIAGEWTFTVKVKDGDGLVTPASQKVSIGNRPPTVTLAPGPMTVDHIYQKDAARYFAMGTVRAKLEDPDGDPIPSAELRLVESAPTSCSFRVNDTALHAGDVASSFEVTCPGTNPEQLIGQVTRQLVLSATDVNGGVTPAPLDLVIANRQPFFTWMGGSDGAATWTLTVAHAVASCPGFGYDTCFSVDGTSPLGAIDPDGDPLARWELRPAGFDPLHGTWSSDGQSFRWLSEVSRPDLFRARDGSSPVAVTAVVHDPWDASLSSDATFRLKILNLPPTTALVPGVGAVRHSYSSTDLAYHAAVDLFLPADPTGDPVTLRAASADGMCDVSPKPVNGLARVTCSLPYDWTTGAAPPLAKLAGVTHALQVAASDAWEEGALSAVGYVSVTNTPPSVVGGTVHYDSCVCQCPLSGDCHFIEATGCANVTFEPGAQDADGTPVRIEFGPSSLATPYARNCIDGHCAIQLNLCAGQSIFGSVTVTDGLASASALYLFARTCTAVGGVCGSVGGGGSCFVAGTPVTMADGSLRAIEALRAGDRVLAYDPARGAAVPRRVLQTFVHPATPRLLRINGRITTTPEHLFFVEGRWVAAGALAPGDLLLRVSADPASPLREPVVSLEPLPGDVTTYNLEVEELHDYVADGVLVHNTKSCGPSGC